MLSQSHFRQLSLSLSVLHSSLTFPGVARNGRFVITSRLRSHALRRNLCSVHRLYFHSIRSQRSISLGSELLDIVKAALGSTRPLTETELEYAVGGRPFDVSLYELLLADSPERVFRKMIQQHPPPLFPGVVWKYISCVSVFMLLGDVYVVFVPNPISDWLIDSFGAPQAALVAFALLFVFPAVSIASWRLATRRSRTQYPLVPPATGFELLEVPSNDTKFACPECKGVGKWAETRYEAARWESGTENGEGEDRVFVPDQVITTEETVCKTCSGRGYLYHMKKRFERANKSRQKLNSNLDVVNSKVVALNSIIRRTNWELVQRR